MKRSEFLELIYLAIDQSSENIAHSTRVEHEIAREALRVCELPTEDVDGKINPIVESIVYGRHCGRGLNVYSTFQLLIAVEKAWEYYQLQEKKWVAPAGSPNCPSCGSPPSEHQSGDSRTMAIGLIVCKKCGACTNVDLV
jgi:hypothetical protein